jgi:glutaminyl-tRNA synthetase
LVITNYPTGQTELMDVENNPEAPETGSRQVPFSGELYIEREDFMEEPSKKFFRLAPGQMVRLKSAYIIQCEDFVKDPATGQITEIRCTYFPESRSGNDTSGLKAKGTLHWVSAAHAIDAEVRLYDRLFTDPEPTGHEGKDFMEFVNPESLQVIAHAQVEPGLREAVPGQSYQFIRKGYFSADADTTAEKPVFNLTATLKDSWKGGS